MKWLLISMALNLQVTYPDQKVCMTALEQVKTQDMAAICIPAGEDKIETQMNSVFTNFLGLVKELQKMELENSKENGTN
jgi:hypothetical protein|tara:strand:+ start:5054 stop:5290 length:237 start_codon:yes stop_codon:yes gene_type:complete